MLEPEQLIGEQIKQYKIQDHIDRGGMADVYLALDETLQRQVALKIMLPAFAHDKQFVERFWREAQTAARLDHTHIIQVFEIGNTDDHRPYIAMQYIDGGSLKDKLLALDGRLMPVEEALKVVRQVAVALGVAHDASIVHRDVKPSNVLLRPDGTPVLVDLGIAAVQTGQKLTQTGTLIGTPHYMSPEQVSGEGVDGRSDLYSLGIVLYELLCGSRPFEANDSLAVLHKHVYEEPLPLSSRRAGLSQQTYRLTEICMQKDPNHRYQTASELVAAIDRALEAEQNEQIPSIPWRPPVDDPTLVGPPRPIPQPEAKSRPWWLLALIPVVLLALFGAYQLFGGGVDDVDVTPTIVATTMAIIAEDITVTEEPPTQPAPEVPIVVEDPTAIPEPTAVPEEPAVESEPTAVPEVPTATPVPLPTDTPAPPSPTPLPPTATATPDLGPERVEIGRSVLGKPIEAVRFGAGENSIIFIGGLHAGAAPSSVTLAQRAITHFQMNLQQIPPEITLYIIPLAGPDSPRAPGELRGRLNANGVDLNRNWDCRWVTDAKWRGQVVDGSGGPFPFSEPETQALVNFIREKNAIAVTFWEARAVNGLSSPGACGERSLVSGRLAQAYGLAADYPIADFESLTDQEINGDATNWLDLQGIASISVLLPEYDDVDWNNNLAGIMGVLFEYSR